MRRGKKGRGKKGMSKIRRKYTNTKGKTKKNTIKIRKFKKIRKKINKRGNKREIRGRKTNKTLKSNE